MSYGSGTFELATHYGSHMYLIVRLDNTLSEAEANAIQDGMAINAGSAQPFAAEPVNRESFDAVEQSLRAKLSELVATFGGDAVYGMFTAPTDDSRGLYDFDKYTVGAAIGWGGAQLGDNLYESSPNYPAEGCYSATFDDPDNGAFWSFTVYDQNGFMFDDVAHMSSDIAAATHEARAWHHPQRRSRTHRYRDSYAHTRPSSANGPPMRPVPTTMSEEASGERPCRKYCPESRETSSRRFECRPTS